MVWHGDGDFAKTDLIVVPGGFSYGDYLRCGAMAAQSPVMAEVKRRAAQGVPVLAICNGFQIVTRSRPATGRADAQRAPQVRAAGRASQGRDQPEPVHQPLPGGPGNQGPGGPAEGNYFADEDTLKRLEDRGQVAFRYCGADGTVDGTGNPNGSIRNIAGVFNEARR
jgi:phosphoribosylformylglycinamidine synthase